MMLSILLMMSLGILLMTQLGQQLVDALALTAHQHRYLNAREQAESSLSWGLRQVWPATTSDRWLCQHADITVPGYPPQSLNSCVRPSLRASVFLLKGEGATGNGSPPLVVFQQVEAVSSAAGGRRFTALPQGWLDFCPESDIGYCDGQPEGKADAKGV